LGLKSNDELKLHNRLTSLKMAIKDEEKIVSELQTKKTLSENSERVFII